MSKILIITNHSYMLYRFRLELIQELMKEHEVVLIMPFVGHEEDFPASGTSLHQDGFGPHLRHSLLLRRTAGQRPV